MSSGTGVSAIDDVLNVALNFSTGGLAGFGEDGAGLGALGKPAVEAGVDGLKEITGAKAAEEANAQTRKRFEEEKAKAAQDRLDAQAQSAANQLAASRSAEATRGGVSSQPKGTSRFSSLGSDEEDFLGL